jgi:glycosyltransferase involved in cell wall biosynthesis
MKMCSHFAALGQAVELVLPGKRLTIEGPADPFAYYGIKRNFTIQRVPALDFLGHTEVLGRFLYWLDLGSFLLSLWLGEKPKPGSVLFARDPILFIPYARGSYKRVIEVHDLPYKRSFVRRLIQADSIIVITQALKDDLVALGVPESRIMIAPDGVDIEEIATMQNKAAARTALALPQDKSLVLYTGHLYEWKGAATLACAAALVPDALFVFVGGIGEELEHFKKEFRSAPNICIIPFQPHSMIPTYLSAADVLVLPNTAKEKISARYTSPLKLFEYMASGHAIVASDLPSIREILDESTAILVKPDSPETLAEGIKKAIAHKQQADRLAAAAKEKAKIYTWSNRAKSIINFIES